MLRDDGAVLPELRSPVVNRSFIYSAAAGIGQKSFRRVGRAEVIGDLRLRIQCYRETQVIGCDELVHRTFRYRISGEDTVKPYLPGFKLFIEIVQGERVVLR